MFNKLPKMIVSAIHLIKALDLRETIRLIQEIIYLYREFYIKTKVTPVITEYKVSFYYKDTRLAGTKIKEPKELLKLIDDIKRSRADGCK